MLTSAMACHLHRYVKLSTERNMWARGMWCAVVSGAVLAFGLAFIEMYVTCGICIG